MVEVIINIMHKKVSHTYAKSFVNDNPNHSCDCEICNSETEDSPADYKKSEDHFMTVRRREVHEINNHGIDGVLSVA